jgi:hypothetical protein
LHGRRRNYQTVRWKETKERKVSGFRGIKVKFNSCGCKRKEKDSLKRRNISSLKDDDEFS